MERLTNQIAQARAHLRNAGDNRAIEAARAALKVKQRTHDAMDLGMLDEVIDPGP